MLGITDKGRKRDLSETDVRHILACTMYMRVKRMLVLCMNGKGTAKSGLHVIVRECAAHTRTHMSIYTHIYMDWNGLRL